MRKTVLEVNVTDFKNNINIIREYTKDKEIMPVIKANGYGTFINTKVDLLNEFNIVAVALVDEAIFL